MHGRPKAAIYALSNCCSMIVPFCPEGDVPICPSGIGALLVESGWQWDLDLLDEVTTWLEAQGLSSKRSFIGLEYDDLEDTQRWDP